MAGEVPFFVPDITDREMDAVVSTLRSGWLTTGTRAAEFERRFAECVGAEHALAVNSCTAALHLALVAAGIGPGDEVVVPTMTFAATAEVVAHTGATTVLVDVDEDSLLVRAEDIEPAITPRTRAVMPVHFAGQPCDMDPIIALARRHDLAVVEDAAHAFPAEYGGTPVGSIGDMTCFSFYANKTMTTGEGGMLTTSRADIAEKASRLRLHGLTAGAAERFRVPASWRYDIVEAGFKYNMPDTAASLGVEQLARVDEMHAGREAAALLYDRLLSDVPGVQPLRRYPDRKHAWHLYVVRVDGVSRDDVIPRLAELGVGTSVHYRPLHLHSYYRDRYGYRPEQFPNASRAFEAIISLPLFSTMTSSQVERVVETLRQVIEGGT